MELVTDGLVDEGGVNTERTYQEFLVWVMKEGTQEVKQSFALFLAVGREMIN